MEESRGLRIGQFAERVGVSRDVLRSWERRYGLLPPNRSAGNYRLYGEHEERLVREVIALRDQGLPIADAVAAARNRWELDGGVDDDTAEAALRSAHAAVRDFDEPMTRTVIQGAVSRLGIQAAIRDVVMPLLERIGDDWAHGRIGVAHEHLASHAVRRELGAAGLTKAMPGAPVVVLACPPGELHDIVLLCLGVLLSHRGVSVRFLGANTPFSALQRACEQVSPDLVVLSASRPSVLEARGGAVRALARSWPVAIGGRGATPRLARQLGSSTLPGGIDEAVDAIATLTPARSPSTLSAPVANGTS